MPQAVLVALSLVAAACSEMTPQAVGQWTGPRVIFTPEMIAGQNAMTRRFADVPAPPYWVPSDAAIVRAENTLWGQLDGNRRGCVRQILGIQPEGRRVVRVQGFCCQDAYADAWWERTIGDLIDTGGCVFAADFDPETGALLEIRWGTPGPG